MSALLTTTTTPFILSQHYNSDGGSTRANTASPPLSPKPTPTKTFKTCKESKKSKNTKANPWKKIDLTKYNHHFLPDKLKPIHVTKPHLLQRKRFNSVHYNDHNNSQTQPPTKNRVVKFKTEMCKNFKFNGVCAFGDSVG